MYLINNQFQVGATISDTHNIILRYFIWIRDSSHGDTRSVCAPGDTYYKIIELVFNLSPLIF